MVIRGSQNTQKRRTRMKKCGLGDLGAPRRSKALKTQLCDSDPSEHQKTSYTYAKTRKRLFVTLLFFGKVKKYSLFPRAFREGKLSTEVHIFLSKTLQVAKVAPLELFSLQNDTIRTFHTCPTFLGVLRAPKRVWALKTRFGAISAPWDPKIVRVAGAV